MPAGLFAADAAFPDLGAKAATEDKLRAVQDYLYMLLETLRWTLRHLSADNFSDADAAGLVAAAVQKHPEVFDTLIADTVISDAVITNELYGVYGDVADLTVDELRTDWQKAARYLAGDTSPLDWLHICDEQIDFLSGTVVVTDGAPETEQLHRGGRYFWWTDATRTQMTSLEETDWPVTVYRYATLRKGSFRFADCAGPGGAVTKVPTLVLGAGTGDAADPDLGKGFLRKGTASLDLWLHGATDKGLFIGEYADLVGARKTTRLDFSRWDAGVFSETVDGAAASAYAVDFDAQDRPVKITDAAGHETEVVW